MSVQPAEEVPQKITLGYLLNNLLSIAGLCGLIVFGSILLFRMGSDLLGINREMGAYGGLVTYMVLPALLLLSLLLCVVGLLWKWRVTRRSGLQGVIPGKTRARRIMTASIAAGLIGVWLIFSSFTTYKAYEYADSTTFCGRTCHQVMEPEFTAYSASSHARVKCVECHIGPGADWFVKAKISGIRQVLAVANQSFKTPIKTPLHNLRPARDTCEHCHWPGRFSGSMERIITHYASDDENTPTRFNLLMKVGGGHSDLGKPSGIHWHISTERVVQYLALDERRQEIPYVRVTYKEDGRTEEFMVQGFDPKQVVEANLRTMDCLDCHTRPAHNFRSPNRALNLALDRHLISASLPGIKRLGMKLLGGEYKTHDQAEAAMRAAFVEYLKEHKLEGERKKLAEQACEQIVKIYRTNFFPEHGVDYRAFIENISHFESKGCERCHDAKHSTPDAKKTISHDCTNCHLIIGQASGVKEVAAGKYQQTEFEHPEDPVPLTKLCSSCHAQDKGKKE